MNLEGRVALVTGSARRVGRAIALELARGGCNVAVHYSTSTQDAEETAAGIAAHGRRAVTFQADFSRSPDGAALVEQVVAKMGRLDILVNNASMFIVEQGDSIEDFRADVSERMFRVNAIAPACLATAAAAPMRRQGGGKIVNIVDIAADRPWVNHLGYCASKAALVCVTRALAKGLAPEIQVNGVAPGIAAFPEVYDAATRERLIRKVPARRPGCVEDIARTVRFLVEGPDYITGQILGVDGGRSLA